MDGTVYTLLNEQIQKELYSAYFYLDMADYYSDAGLAGFSNWFYIQAQEEMDHAMLFRGYLLNNSQKVKLLPVNAPKDEYPSFSAPLEASLKHEQYVTSAIYAIYDAALAAKDYRSTEFLNWFIKEQGEEEKNAADLLQKYQLFGGDPKGLYALNQELAGRAYTAPDLVLD